MIVVLALLASAPTLAADVSELVGKRRMFDPALEGSQRYALFMGDLNLGQATVVVEPAGRRDKAVYHTRTLVELSMAPMEMKAEESMWLDAELSIVRGLLQETQINPSGTQHKQREISREGKNQWTLTQGGEEPRSTTMIYAGSNYKTMSCQMMLARILDGQAPGSWELPTLRWRREDAEPRVEVIELRAGPVETIDHWGEPTEATPVTFLGNDRGTFYVAGGQVLRVMPSDAPFMMVACEGEQCRADLPPDNPEEPHIKAVLEVYFGVLLGSEPVDRLDEIVDWQMVHDSSPVAAPEALTEGGIEGYIAGVKAEIEQRAGILGAPPVPIRVVLGMAELTYEEDRVRVRLPGRANAVVLYKGEAGWKLQTLAW